MDSHRKQRHSAVFSSSENRPPIRSAAEKATQQLRTCTRLLDSQVGSQAWFEQYIGPEPTDTANSVPTNATLRASAPASRQNHAFNTALGTGQQIGRGNGATKASLPIQTALTVDDLNRLEGECEDLSNRVRELELAAIEVRKERGIETCTFYHVENEGKLEIQRLMGELGKAKRERDSLQVQLDGSAQDASHWKDKYNSLLVKIHSVVDTTAS
ncbi:hypothetical protein BDP27DRAFT_1429363 [Rhodocollybia butyracea]|uniref:Uncharacterized protein n=1 Tax=Rhodocollybia butyracea TaxID=206335 RepID=A0A9P5U049_9AGAR|nr:hypothetical protein BDP27DRAFT_1429363 [Rhodocollybia butyracea]